MEHDLQKEVGEWARSTFPGATDKSILTHLRREVDEIEKSLDLLDRDLPGPIRKQMKTEAGFELSDVYLMLLHLAHRHAIDLQSSAIQKFEICKARQWGEPDAEGVREHIRETAPNVTQ